MAQVKMTFCGGAQSVTGANYLIETETGQKILIDCGLAQGSRFAEDLNYAPFSYAPAEIDTIIITHAHADHFGRLPKLYRDGFRGRVLTSNGTRDVMEQAFPDNWQHISEEAKLSGHPPLYTEADATGVMELVEGLDYYQTVDLGQGNSMSLLNAGHILGSSLVHLEINGKVLGFSGDLGNSGSLLMPEKDFIKDADYITVESAYGGRIHEDKTEREAKLLEALMHVVAHKGALMLPVFAVERAQEILFVINKLVENKIIPVLPVFFDSPLAIEMTRVYRKHQSEFNQAARDLIASGDDIFNFPGLRLTESVMESKKINDTPGPKIILAGSGMSTGGRILHHERRYLPGPDNAIVFVGYQVDGSLGRKILEGQRHVRIYNESVAVGCVIKAIGGFSGHADQPQLVDWVERANESGKLKKVFLVQGEDESAIALSEAIKAKISVDTVIPKMGESFEL